MKIFKQIKKKKENRKKSNFSIRPEFDWMSRRLYISELL